MRVGVYNEWATYWSGERIQCPYCKVIQDAKAKADDIFYPVRCPNCHKVLIHYYPVYEVTEG